MFSKSRINVYLFASLVLLSGCSKPQASPPLKHYHFTACAGAFSSLIFSIPGDPEKVGSWTSVTVRRDFGNPTTLLLRNKMLPDRTIEIGKGNIDTTFRIADNGKMTSFFFLTPKSRLSSEQRRLLVKKIKIISLPHIDKEPFEALGAIEMIVRR
ncbi:hypothetical protein [Ravibacter arvi]|uniref:hypothetical protein n=1 Tax=Ravibacter arvi TaxID=2051041 RepID=UPI0031E915B7